MARLQVQLPEDELARLRAVAKGLNRSVSDSIREGISMFLARASRPEPDALAGLVNGFAPLPPDDPNSLDTWLADAIIASKRGDGTE